VAVDVLAEISNPASRVPIEVEEGDFEALSQETIDPALAIAIRELLDVLQLPELVEEQSAGAQQDEARSSRMRVCGRQLEADNARQDQEQAAREEHEIADARQLGHDATARF
jgi:hypothetical protein